MNAPTKWLTGVAFVTMPALLQACAWIANVGDVPDATDLADATYATDAPRAIDAGRDDAAHDATTSDVAITDATPQDDAVSDANPADVVSPVDAYVRYCTTIDAQFCDDFDDITIHFPAPFDSQEKQFGALAEIGTTSTSFVSPGFSALATTPGPQQAPGGSAAAVYKTFARSDAGSPAVAAHLSAAINIASQPTDFHDAGDLNAGNILGLHLLLAGGNYIQLFLRDGDGQLSGVNGWPDGGGESYAGGVLVFGPLLPRDQWVRLDIYANFVVGGTSGEFVVYRGGVLAGTFMFSALPTALTGNAQIEIGIDFSAVGSNPRSIYYDDVSFAFEPQVDAGH